MSDHVYRCSSWEDPVNNRIPPVTRKIVFNRRAIVHHLVQFDEHVYASSECELACGGPKVRLPTFVTQGFEVVSYHAHGSLLRENKNMTNTC